MGAVLSFIYGAVVYAFFLGTFLYAIAFVGNLPVPKTIDSGEGGPLLQALLVDLALLWLFALQHSVMARRSFKAWWTKLVPPVVERSTFVLASSAVLALLLWQWQPISHPLIWQVTNVHAEQLLWGVFWLGWAILLFATFLINHFELFGLRQVWARISGRAIPEPEFRTPLLYRYVRHPIYLGFLLAFWATPTMSAGHLLFSIACTGYILIGIWFEERDLIAQFGDQYRRYRAQVGMLIPSRRPDALQSAPTPAGGKTTRVGPRTIVRDGG